jgi:hypothetical protein
MQQTEPTYSAACSGVKIACNDLTVDPSDISAKANRFCFLTDLINPFNVISSFSYLCTFVLPSVFPVVVAVAFKSSAHRNRLAARRLDGVYRLTMDVENKRRHARIARMRSTAEKRLTEILLKTKWLLNVNLCRESCCSSRNNNSRWVH